MSLGRDNISAFGGCNNLTDVYYAGSERDRETNLGQHYEWDLDHATWHYNYAGTGVPVSSPSPITADNPDIPNEARLISNFTASRTVNYKSTVVFAAPADIPAGSTVHWIVNGEDVAQGNTYTNEKATGNYTVQSKVVDANGNVTAESEVETVTVKQGFFDKLIALFLGWFNALPVIVQ